MNLFLARCSTEIAAEAVVDAFVCSCAVDLDPFAAQAKVAQLGLFAVGAREVGLGLLQQETLVVQTSQPAGIPPLLRGHSQG